MSSGGLAMGQVTGSIGTGTQTNSFDQIKQFLGEPAHPINPTAYDRHKVTNYDLPEAYKGKNLFLNDRITGLILEDNEWYTTTCLPWSYTDQLHISWNTWNFNAHLADRVPHEGISRLIQSSKSQDREHVVRRGIAFIMEADFWRTAEGQQHYFRNLMAISSAIQETQNYDTINSLLLCKKYTQLWQHRFGTPNGLTLDQVLSEEVSNYGCVAKEEQRLDILVEEHKRLMGKKRIVPDLLILWPTAKIYLTMVGASRETLYWTASENSRLVERRGPKSLGVFRDLDVFEVRDFIVTEDSIPVQLLNRTRSIGERYTMFATQFRNSNFQHYETRHRDIWIYDENKDTFVKIEFKKAFKNCGLFDDNTKEYSDNLKKLINIYRNETRTFDFSKENPLTSSGAKSMKTKNNKETFPPHFLTHNLSANGNDTFANWQLVKYFGQINRRFLEPSDFQKAAESVLSRVGGDLNENIRVWHDTIRLIKQIEDAPYDRDFFSDLIIQNRDRTVTQNNELTFNGHPIPEKLSERWGQQLLEWQPNAHGSMDLPQYRGMPTFPPGYANWPGFLTLADEATKEGSHWKSIGERAQKSVSLIQRIVNVLQRAIPDSESIKPVNRSPWFHIEDAATTFFENCISTPRDALFLLLQPEIKNLKNTTSQPTVQGESKLPEKTDLSVEFELNTLKNEIKGVSDNSSSILLRWFEEFNNSPKFTLKDGFALLQGFKKKHVNESKSNITDFIQIIEQAEDAATKFNDSVQKKQQIIKFIQEGRKDPEYQTFEKKIVFSGEQKIPKIPTSAVKKTKGSIDGLKGTTTLNKSGIINGENQYFRAPLSMSFALLKSLLENSDEFLFALPGDPTFSNLTVLNLRNNVTQEQVERSYKKLVNNRMQYKEIASIIQDPSLKKLSSHGLFNQAISAQINSKKSSSSFGSTSTIKKQSFLSGELQDEEDYGSEDEMRDVFGGSGKSVSKKIGNLYKTEPKDREKYDEILGRDGKTVDKDGNKIGINDIHNPVLDSIHTHEIEEQHSEIKKFSNPILSAIACAFLLAPCDKLSYWESLMNHDIHVPVNIILWRIGITHDMATGVMMKRGLETGINAYGHTNFVLGSDVQTKMIYGNYTFNSKCVILKHENVTLLEDIAPQGYRGGNNTEFITSEKQLNFLNQEAQHGTNMPSIIATAVPVTEESLNKIASITGKVNVSSGLLFHEQSTTYSYSTCEFTILRFGLHKYIPYTSVHGQDNYFSRTEKFNDVAFQGLQFSYNSNSRQYNNVTKCQGHRGPNGSQPGSADVWNGKKKYLSEFKPNDWHFE